MLLAERRMIHVSRVYDEFLTAKIGTDRAGVPPLLKWGAFD